MTNEKMIAISLLLGALLPYLVLPFGKAGRTYDNANPRRAEGYDTALKQRAMGAHYNGIEAFVIFAPAVLAALWFKVPPAAIAPLAMAWVVARLAYVGCYLGNLALPRSLCWLVGWGLTIALFVKALP